MSEMVGRKLGDYRIVDRIGAGAMGTVFRAENIHHKKTYALKILRSELGKDADFRKRFFDEARVMSDLNHPNIVRVHHMGEDEGVYYLVMDYVASPGGRPRSLHEELAESPTGRIAPNKVYRWSVQMVQGLAYAHKRGVIHRDIKPSNVLIGSDGSIRIADFGLVKLAGRESIDGKTLTSIRGADPARLQSTVTAAEGRPSSDGAPLDVSRTVSDGIKVTPSSSPCGTPYFIPPEVSEGEEWTRQGDLYSLGVTIYRMLTGMRPAGMPKLPSKVVPRLSRHWDTVARRCLANTPEDRYGSAEELLRDLRKLAKPRRVRMTAAVGMLVMIAVVGGAGLSGVNFRQAWKSVQDTIDTIIHRRIPPPPIKPGSPTVEDQQKLLEDLRQILKDRPEFADLLRKVDEQRQKANSLLTEGKRADAVVAYGGTIRSVVDATEHEAQQSIEMLTEFSSVEGYVSKVEPLRTKKAQADALRSRTQYVPAANTYLAVIQETPFVLRALQGGQNQTLEERQRLLESLCQSLKDHPEFADLLRKVGEQIQKANSLCVEGKNADAVMAYGGAITNIVDAVDRETQRNLETLAGFSGVEGDTSKVEPLKTRKTQADAFRRKAEYASAVNVYLAVIAEAQPMLAAQRQYQDALAVRKEAEGERAKAEAVEANVCICPQGTTTCVCFQRIYNQGQVLLRDGENSLKQEQFAVASQNWADAKTCFQNAVASALREVEKSRGAWQVALAQPMSDRLKAFAGEAEQEVDKAQAAEKQGKLRTALLSYRRATLLHGLTEELSLPVGEGVRLSLVFIPAGEFEMGSSPDDTGRRKEEYTRHVVTMKKAFYIGEFEVTQEQYRAVTGRNPSTFQGASLPADSVSWLEAEQFCATLTGQVHSLGYGRVRLPTETEWEYACRAGTTSDYSAGDGERALQKVGWYRQIGSMQIGRSRPVGQLDANRWGLHDMHGNIWEWCQNAFVASVVSDETKPSSQDNSASRALRGGSWNTDLFDCRSASRRGEPPQTKRNDIGFRVVMDIE